jgi:plasmid maintenance system antidote protein VapI
MLVHSISTSTEFWLNLQNLYELRLAERRHGKSIKKLPTLKRAKVAWFRRSTSFRGAP